MALVVELVAEPTDPAAEILPPCDLVVVIEEPGVCGCGAESDAPLEPESLFV